MNPDNVSSGPVDWPSRLQKQYKLVSCAEEVLGEQRAEFERTLSEFLEIFKLSAAPQQTQLTELQKENEALRLLLQCQKDVPTAGLADAAVPAEVEDLRKQLEAKQAQIDELRTSRLRPANSSGEEGDFEDYEAELNEFRRQIEVDRQTLNEELEQLRARNTELNDAAREAELELSKERAQMARDRIELERMRAEIQQEMDDRQRNEGMRERFAMLQRRSKAGPVQVRSGEKANRADSANGHANSKEAPARAGLWRSLISLATDTEE